MKHVVKGLIAGVSLNFATATAQDTLGPSFMMTLSNKHRLSVDCGKLADGKKTMGFLSQFEPYTDEQVARMTLQQQAWLKMSRQSRATDFALLEQIATHLDTGHGVKRHEIEVAYQHCLTLQK